MIHHQIFCAIANTAVLFHHCISLLLCSQWESKLWGCLNVITHNHLVVIEVNISKRWMNDIAESRRLVDCHSWCYIPSVNVLSKRPRHTIGRWYSVRRMRFYPLQLGSIYIVYTRYAFRFLAFAIDTMHTSALGLWRLPVVYRLIHKSDM